MLQRKSSASVPYQEFRPVVWVRDPHVKEAGIPLIVGSRGTGGTDSGVRWVAGDKTFGTTR